MRFLSVLILLTLTLSGCETTSNPTGNPSVVRNGQPSPAAHQNQNPNNTAGKMMSPLM